MKYFQLLLKAFILITISININAETNFPYEYEGMLLEINPETGQTNVGDMIYTIPSHAIIHYPSGGKRIGLENLSSNTPIGYNMERNIITEIWILDRAPIDHSVNDDQFIRSSYEKN